MNITDNPVLKNNKRLHWLGNVHVCGDIKRPGCILFLLYDTTFLCLLWETRTVTNSLRCHVAYWAWKVSTISYIKGNFLVKNRILQPLDLKRKFFGSYLQNYFKELFYYVPNSKLKYNWISEPWNFFSRNCLVISFWWP